MRVRTKTQLGWRHTWRQWRCGIELHPRRSCSRSASLANNFALCTWSGLDRHICIKRWVTGSFSSFSHGFSVRGGWQPTTNKYHKAVKSRSSALSSQANRWSADIVTVCELFAKNINMMRYISVNSEKRFAISVSEYHIIKIRLQGMGAKSCAPGSRGCLADV